MAGSISSLNLYSPRMLNILILEDHPMMVESIRASVQGTTFKTKVYVANNLSELSTNARLLAMAPPAMIVTDLNVPDSQGFATLQFLRERYPSTPILVFSQNDELMIEQRALALGATAFVNKSRHPKVFVQKLQEMLADIHERMPAWMEPPSVQSDDLAEEDKRFTDLTPQQNKVLIGIANGLSTEKIAEHLDMVEQTVRAHLTGIYQRLGVKNRSQAVVLYLQWKSHHES
jgi:DNA-binding NarL/FixJ family response regulator